MSLYKTAPITSQDFEKLAIEQKKPVLICFLEEWSEPCKEMEPIVDELNERLAGMAEVYSIDLEGAPLIAARLSINTIPALVLFVNGEPVQKIFGVRSLEDSFRILHKHLQCEG